MNPKPRSLNEHGLAILKRLALLLLLATLVLDARAAETASQHLFNGATPLEWSVRLANSEMARRGDKLAWKPGGTAKWDYTAGLFTLSLLKLNECVPDARYTRFAEAAIGSFISAEGKIQGYKREDYNLDNLNPGKTALMLYDLAKDEKYRVAADSLRKQLDAQPRTTEGGFWHKQRYPDQMWLDGLYMGSAFLAQYAARFGDPAALDEVAKQIRLVAAHTHDPAAGLYYHGWDESKKQDWANPSTGTSSNFWGRAIGWYGMAMVDALDYFPEAHPARGRIIEELRRLTAGILKYQDPASGLWFQVVDQGSRPGNYLEATASSMFTYVLAKGINHGYLSRETRPALLKAYLGLVSRLLKTDPSGEVSLVQCCSVAGLGYGRSGSFDYYVHEPIVDNDLKGVGPFILAGIELQKLVGLSMEVQASTWRTEPGKGAAKSAYLANEWREAEEILARIKAPVFPNREFPVTKHGASAGKDCTEAIAKAIAACVEAGGGRVIVPAGEYVTGPIHLRSNVELHLEGGATLKFKTEPKAYLPAVRTRFEGMECYNYSPLIYAYGQENVAVTGEGVLDGQASDDNWWQWKGKKQVKPGEPNQKEARERLAKLVEENAPVEERRFGEGSFLRPSFVEFHGCRNVLIEGVRIRRSPMWELHPLLCTNVIVRGVDILSHGPNNDGCDPESCRDVLIEDCVFDTGDDCIAIKSGRNNDGRRVGVPSENIIVRRCTMKDGHGGVVIGSEISGGCRNVFAEDCTMDSPNLDRVLRLKSNAVRGGVVENVFLRNVKVGQVADAVLQIDFLYEEGSKGSHMPVARNIIMEGLAVDKAPRIFNVAGFPGATIAGVRVRNSTFKVLESADKITEAEVKMENCVVEARGSSETEENFKLLFNRRDLAGWQPMNDAVFLATNGVIRISKGMGWLRAEQPLTNFVFEAEWRALEEKYNSGLFLRAGTEGKPFPDEVWQVNLKESALGSLMKGSTTVVTNCVLKVPVKEWARFRMEVRGRNVALEVNGKPLWQFSGLDTPAGYVGLQAEGKAFEFRNLRLKPLP